jgi:hypothetical protein
LSSVAIAVTFLFRLSSQQDPSAVDPTQVNMTTMKELLYSLKLASLKEMAALLQTQQEEKQT